MNDKNVGGVNRPFEVFIQMSMSGITFNDAPEMRSSATRSCRYTGFRKKQKCVPQPYTGFKRLRQLQPKGSFVPKPNQTFPKIPKPKVRTPKVNLLLPPPKWIFCLPPVEYKCENCAIVFWRETTLQLHKQFCCAPSAEKPYNCEICCFGFSRQDILLKHMETRHGHSLHRCETCGAAFRLKSILIRHCFEQGHEIFKCEICASAFLTADDLQNHVATIHMTDIKNKQSKVCGTVVPEGVLQQELLKQPGSSERLNISQVKDEVQKPETETVTHSAKNGFKCETCGIVFLRDDILQKHVLARHVSSRHEPTYKCEECSALFHRKTLLTKHMRVHHFECGECGKIFAKKVSLRNHIISCHTPDDKKSFLCENCGNRFASKLSLNKHAIVHLSEQSFKCGICDRGFKTKYGFKLHGRIHAGDKPHKCTICGKAFLQSNRLAAHFALHSTGKLKLISRQVDFRMNLSRRFVI